MGIATMCTGATGREGKGAYTYDVCTGMGVPQKADALKKLSKGNCVKRQTGGRWIKNQKILQTSYVHGPVGECTFAHNENVRRRSSKLHRKYRRAD